MSSMNTGCSHQHLDLHAKCDFIGASYYPICRLSIAYRPSYNLNLPPITEPRESTNATRPLQLGPVTPDQQKLQKSNKILQVPHFSIDEGRLSIPCRPSYNLNLPPITEPGESTNAARPLQLGPVTPDQQKLQKTNKILQVPHFSIDEGLSKENNKQDNVFPPQDEIAERECNGSVCDASSSPISTMQNEKQTIDGGNDGEIDLNKTPPQKTPKRRKHRPKVVVEGKPKRTPKPKATESNTTGGNSTIKRKYIRKKGINTSTDQSIDARNGVEVSNVESQAKSCKRALNFDLENEIGKKIKGREFDHQADNIKGSTLNLNVDLHSPELEGRPASTVENVHQNLCGKGKQTENLYNFIHSVGKITPEELAVPPTSKNHTLNVLARVLNMRNANTNQSGGHGMNGQVQHHIGGSLAQILANTRKQNLDGYRQPKLLNRPQLLEDFVDVSERQESKRDYSCTEIRRPPVASQIWSHAVSGTGHNNRDSIEFWQNCLEASRTKNVEQFFGRKSSMPPSKTTLEDCSEQIQSTRNRNFCPESSKLHQNGGLPYYSGEGKSTFIDLTNETNMVIHQWCKNSTDSGHKYQKQVSPYAKQMAHRAHHFAKSQTTNSLIAVDNFHMVFASQRDSQVTKGNQTTNVPTLLSTRRRAAKPMPSNIISKNLQGSRHESKKVAGAHEYNRNIFSIDDITKRMKDLHIDSFGEQNALVPYRGDGAVVPFEVFDPIKKRRPRPKVDLDPETTRLWNLLMGKEGSESAEPVDNGKQKYWEEERKVFRGRVDSFIARMHLVQGDRRFSKWKGSVVDSVIGVFLTQNVSDHLSSSAFMSLVAKFPAMRESCCQNSRNPSNEHEVIISYPDKRTSCHHPLIREPVIHHSSVTSSQQSRYKAENITSGKSFSIHNHTRRKEEECMILSQCSSESLSFQASEDIRSSSGSNSEVEDHITGSSFRKNLGTLNWYQHAERIDAFQQYEVQEMGSSFADNRPSNNVQPPENLVQNQNPGVASGRNAYSGIHRKMLMGIEEREADLLELIGKERSHAFQQCEVQEMGSSFADNRPSNNVQPPENLVQNQNPGVASGRNAYSGIHRKMLMGIEEREADLLEFIGKERSHAFQQCEVQEMGSSFADNRPSNNVQPPENLVQKQNPGVASGRNAYSGIHRKMLMGIEEREADLLEFIGKERSHAFQQCEVQEMGSSFADNRSSNNVQPPKNLVQNQNPGVASGRNAYSRPLTSSVLHYQRPAPPSNDSWQKMLMGIKERESDLEFIEKERSHAFQQFEVQEMGSSFADNRPSNNVQQPENLVQNQNPGVASSRNAYSRPLTSSVLHYQRPAPPSNNFWQKMLMGIEERESDLLEFIEKESSSSLTSEYVDTAKGTTMKHVQDKARQSAESSLTDQQSRSSNFFNHELINKQPGRQMNLLTESQSRNSQHFINFCPRGMQETSQPESSTTTDPIKSAEVFRQTQSDNQNPSGNNTLEPIKTKTLHVSDVQSTKVSTTSNARKRKAEKEQVEAFDWDTLRKHVQSEAGAKSRSSNTADSLNYEALRNADVHEISDAIKERGMNNMLAARMKDFLNRLVKDHGSMDLEWLRDVQPDKAKDYLLSIRGLGLKSVECVRLLTLHHLAFPVDTNVGRIAVRLGWVPLQPLPETLQLHLLELYPVLESIQKYLWPRLCMLDQETLYELHYQLITFGKVFCTKRQPNCNACPMRGECRHFASAFASARLALPGPEERSIVCSDVPSGSSTRCGVVPKPMPLPPPEDNVGRGPGITRNCEPIIEEPATPESSIEVSERDIEDAFYEDPDEIPEIKLNIEEFTSNLQSFIQEKMEIQEGDMSKALVALSPQFASIPMPKLKQVTRLRTEHQVYELLDSHPLLEGLDRREPDDPSPYLLAIWAPGETADSVEPPESRCTSSKAGHCNTKTCFSCNSTREAEAQTVRGTILIPCRTAMRGSFPLNGTYFQVNEVFADNETSMNPIDVPRSLIWNLPRRTVFFGTSVSTIFKGMSTEDIQYCFWKGFVCVRGFDQKTRAPRPLKARLHLAASKIVKKNE